MTAMGRNEIINAFKLDPKVVFFIPTAVDTSVFKRRNIKKDIDLLYVGRFAIKKNLISVIKVIHKLKTDFPNINARFIGGTKDDADYSRIVDLIDNYGLQNNVILSPPMSQFDLVNIYNRSKVFVLLSYEEGMPKVLLEAMACCLPVIAANNSGMIDLIINEKNGFLVNPNNIDEIANKISIILRGKFHLEKESNKIYSWKFVASRLLEVYNSL